MNLEGLGIARVNLGFFDRVRVTMRNPDLRPAWRVARKPIRKDLREHANRESGPGGSWAPASAATKHRQAQGRKRPRKMLGRLPGALKTAAQRTRFLITWRAPWASAQREGGIVGHGARLPARDWAYISDKATQKVADIIAVGLAFLIEAS